MSADLLSRLRARADKQDEMGAYPSSYWSEDALLDREAAAHIEKLEAALRIERKAKAEWRRRSKSKDQLRFDIQAALNRSIG